jgi:hypothetical protein
VLLEDSSTGATRVQGRATGSFCASLSAPENGDGVGCLGAERRVLRTGSRLRLGRTPRRGRFDEETEDIDRGKLATRATSSLRALRRSSSRELSCSWAV